MKNKNKQGNPVFCEWLPCVRSHYLHSIAASSDSFFSAFLPSEIEQFQAVPLTLFHFCHTPPSSLSFYMICLLTCLHWKLPLHSTLNLATRTVLEKAWMKDWFCLIIWSPIDFHWVKLSLAWILTSESPQQKWRPLWLTLVKELAGAWEELNHCENFVLTNIFILRRKKPVL